MGQIYGRVKRVLTKQVGNGGTAYNVQMDDGQYYGFGYEQPPFGDGAEISFDVTWRGNYANAVPESVEVISPGNMGGGQQQQRGGYQQQQRGGYQQRGGQQRGGSNYNGNSGGNRGNPRSGGAGSGGGISKDDYWKRREERDLVVQRQIQYQSSRNAAISFVEMALTAGAVALPSKKADQYDAIMALVDQATEKFDFDVDAVAISAGGKRPAPQNAGAVEDDVPFDQDDDGYND